MSIPLSGPPAHRPVIKAAAQDPTVERIFVNPAIKRALCRSPTPIAPGSQGAPYLGPRLSFPRPHALPARQPECPPQPPVPDGDGCSDGELDRWFRDATTIPRTAETPPKVKPAGAAMAKLPEVPAAEAGAKPKQNNYRHKMARSAGTHAPEFRCCWHSYLETGGAAGDLEDATRGGMPSEPCATASRCCLLAERCDTRCGRKRALLAGTALPPVAFRQRRKRRMALPCVRPTPPWSATMHNLAAYLSSQFRSVGCARARPGAGQNPHGVRRRLDEERAR